MRGRGSAPRGTSPTCGRSGHTPSRGRPCSRCVRLGRIHRCRDRDAPPAENITERDAALVALRRPLQESAVRVLVARGLRRVTWGGDAHASQESKLAALFAMPLDTDILRIIGVQVL